MWQNHIFCLFERHTKQYLPSTDAIKVESFPSSWADPNRQHSLSFTCLLNGKDQSAMSCQCIFFNVKF